MEKKKATAQAPQLELHEFCKMIPEHSEEDYRRLVDDLKKTGKLIEAITTFEGKVLDGRGRQKAGPEAGIEPRYTPFQGDRKQAFDFMLSKNLARRHLTIKQRKALAAVMYKEDPTISTNQVAKTVGLSNKTVEKERTEENLENPNSKGSPPRRKTPSGRGVGGRRRGAAQQAEPAQMTGESVTAIAAMIEELLKLHRRTAKGISEDSKREHKPGYTPAQIQHVLDLMSRDYKVLRVGARWWKWNDRCEQVAEAARLTAEAYNGKDNGTPESVTATSKAAPTELEAAGSTATPNAESTAETEPETEGPTEGLTPAQVAFSNCVVDILEQLGSPRRECEFIAWAHTNLTDIAAKRGNAIQVLAAESVDEDDNEAEIKQQVAAAKRDLIQRLEPHLDALEQGVALLRGDAERRDAPPMADRPKP